jgi:FMN phosphatase YigB (HAD superfamily)
MITTILIDLDDTLLRNDVETFLPAYLKLLSQHLSPFIPAEKMIRQLYIGTQAMIDNTNCDRTLQEAFSENFYPPLGVTPDQLRPVLDSYYAQEFPKLKDLTLPIPSAGRLVSFAMETYEDVVIATNPLFPRTAIEQRLDWAAVSPEQFPYTLITSYEDFHFAKPRMEYVAEILGKLGANPHETVMIGNDDRLDLAPARELGLGTFHVSEKFDETLPGGDLDAAIRWLQNSPPMSDPAQSTSPTAMLARLRGDLVSFMHLESLVPQEQWRRRPAADSWAPVEVLCHLRDVEREINYPRIEKILKENNPFLSSPDSDRWAEERRYIEESVPSALGALIHARKNLLTLLENPSPDVWSRPVRHAIFGPTQMIEVVRIFLEHDLLHIRQIRSALASTAPSS